jgi:hypothetical protein
MNIFEPRYDIWLKDGVLYVTMKNATIPSMDRQVTNCSFTAQSGFQ